VKAKKIAAKAGWTLKKATAIAFQKNNTNIYNTQYSFPD
jgi:hypothetical protein